MLHANVQESGPDYASEVKAKIGIYLFILYALIYAGFVAIAVINVALMDTLTMFGLNLAVFYGFGLIFFALFLAILYNAYCNKKERELNNLQLKTKTEE